MTTGEIQAHLGEIYGADVSRELISKVTDAVNDDLAAWRKRPLDRIYAVVFVDAVMVKIREGQGREPSRLRRGRDRHRRPP